MDFSTVKAIAIPQGNVTKITVGSTVIWQPPKAGPTNWVPKSITTSGGIFSDDGFALGNRLNSSGQEKALTRAILTGYIPVEYGDVLRVYPALPSGDAYCSFNFYDGSFTWLGQVTTQNAGYGICKSVTYSFSTVNNASTLTLNQSNASSIKYVRICHSTQTVGTGDANIQAKFIVTKNEEWT